MRLHRNPVKSNLVREAQICAAQGWHDGTQRSQRYLLACTHVHVPTGAVVMWSRDRGHHESGWWKNPDYDRCRHLSLSFRDPLTLETREHDHKAAEEWCSLFFGSYTKWIWTEPPYSQEGGLVDCYHYRLFINPGGDPIKPRGEVYNREWTPAGWLSWSDRREWLRKQEGQDASS